MLCCYHTKPSPFHARLVDTQQLHQLIQAQCSACARLPLLVQGNQTEVMFSERGHHLCVLHCHCREASAAPLKPHLFALQGNRTSVSSQQQNEEHGRSHDPAASISTRKTRYAADIIRRGLNKEGWKLVITGQSICLLASEAPCLRRL